MTLAGRARAGPTKRHVSGAYAWFPTRRSWPRARTTLSQVPRGRSGSAPATPPCVATMPADAGRPVVLEVARIGLEVRVADPALRLVAEPAHAPFLVEATVEDCASVTLGPATGRPPSRSSRKTLFETGSV